jgi:hypothetical protein
VTHPVALLFQAKVRKIRKRRRRVQLAKNNPKKKKNQRKCQSNENKKTALKNFKIKGMTNMREIIEIIETIETIEEEESMRIDLKEIEDMEVKHLVVERDSLTIAKSKEVDQDQRKRVRKLKNSENSQDLKVGKGVSVESAIREGNINLFNA